MKKQITIVIAILMSAGLYAQTGKTSLKQINENSKSGNFKDIFSSFYRLATENLAGDNKYIEINTTLFALRSNANPDLLKDYNYKKAKFSRNFKFDFKVSLDSTFKYSGFTGGFTIALINDRDKTLANFTGTELDSKFTTNMSGALLTVQTNLTTTIVSNTTLSQENKSVALDSLNQAVKYILDPGKTNLTGSTNPYVSQVLAQLNPLIAAQNSTAIDGTPITDRDGLIKDIDDLQTQYYNLFDSKALWTVSADGSADTDGKFNKASFGTIFLKGNKTAWNEIDIRAKLAYSDTVATGSLPRLNFNGTAGINFKLFKAEHEKSFFEAKVALEYSSILRNAMATEDKDKFLGNAEIRIRLMDDLWIPLIVKYDVENANFLGFLNISYNFGGFKKT